MNTSKLPLHKRLPRLSGWFLITVLLLVCVWAIAPHQLAVSLYKMSLVSLAAVVGYWLDRSIFPYARPDSFLAESFINLSPNIVGRDRDQLILMAVSMLRRAIIIGCAMLTMGLGA